MAQERANECEEHTDVERKAQVALESVVSDIGCRFEPRNQAVLAPAQVKNGIFNSRTLE